MLIKHVYIFFLSKQYWAAAEGMNISKSEINLRNKSIFCSHLLSVVQNWLSYSFPKLSVEKLLWHSSNVSASIILISTSLALILYCQIISSIEQFKRRKQMKAPLSRDVKVVLLIFLLIPFVSKSFTSSRIILQLIYLHAWLLTMLARSLELNYPRNAGKAVLHLWFLQIIHKMKASLLPK